MTHPHVRLVRRALTGQDQRTALALDEAYLEQQVLGTATEQGWQGHHIRDSRKVLMGDAGFPDWVFARAGSVIIAELKREGRRPEAEQEAWLRSLGWDPEQDEGSDAFLDRQLRVYVWRPSDWMTRKVARAFTYRRVT